MRYVSWICVCWYAYHAYHIINLTLEGLEKVEFKIAESLTKLNMSRPSIFNLFWSCIPILQVHAKLVSYCFMDFYGSSPSIGMNLKKCRGLQVQQLRCSVCKVSRKSMKRWKSLGCCLKQYRIWSSDFFSESKHVRFFGVYLGSGFKQLFKFLFLCWQKGLVTCVETITIYISWLFIF